MDAEKYYAMASLHPCVQEWFLAGIHLDKGVYALKNPDNTIVKNYFEVDIVEIWKEWQIQRKMSRLRPSFKVTPTTFDKSVDCQICSLPMERGQTIRHLHNHRNCTFHAACADKWLRRKWSCPNCRATPKYNARCNGSVIGMSSCDITEPIDSNSNLTQGIDGKSHMGERHTEEAPVGEHHTGESHTREPHVGEPRVGEPRVGEANMGESLSRMPIGGPHIGDPRMGDSQTGELRREITTSSSAGNDASDAIRASSDVTSYHFINTTHTDVRLIVCTRSP